jgi:hypothetical protein
MKKMANTPSLAEIKESGENRGHWGDPATFLKSLSGKDLISFPDGDDRQLNTLLKAEEGVTFIAAALVAMNNSISEQVGEMAMEAKKHIKQLEKDQSALPDCELLARFMSLAPQSEFLSSSV